MSEVASGDDSPKITRRNITIFISLSAVGLTSGYIASKMVASYKENKVVDIDGLLWPGTKIKGFNLNSTDGTEFTQESFLGRWSFLFFGFTTCPDTCPTTLKVMATAQNEIRKSELGNSTQVIFVSVDPGRDSIGKMKPYVEYFDPTFKGGTGSIDALNVLTNQLGVFHIRNEPDESGNYDVEHSAAIIVVDPDGRRVGILSTPHAPGNIVNQFQEIRKFVEAQA